MSSFAQSLLAYGGINVLLALGLYVTMATGQLSMGSAGFMAVGAYTAGYLFVKAQASLFVSTLAGGVAAAVLGALVGLPVLRLRGLYLVVATLGFGQVVRTFFLSFKPTGGANGLSGMLGVDLWQIWLTVLVVLALLLWLDRTRLWLGVRTVHDDEFAAELVGYPTTLIKLGMFVLGAFITGIAGGLYAQYNLYIEPQNFSFMESVTIVLFVILGGPRTLLGPVFGALFITVLPELMRGLASWRLAVYGLLLTAVVLFRREGVITPGLLAYLSALLTGKRRVSQRVPMGGQPT